MQRVRMAELVGVLSLATDLGTGHTMERSLRATVLAMRFAEALGLDSATMHDVYFVALLRWSGCTADSTRSHIFGDEIALGPKIDAVELWNPTAMLAFLAEHFPHLSLDGMADGVRASQIGAISHCEIAQNIAARLGLGDGIIAALGQIFERWDGGGVPGKDKGEGLSMAIRVVQIAMDAELFHRVGGQEAALGVVRQRSGGFFDPALCDVFLREGRSLLRAIEAPSVWDSVLADDPAGAQLSGEPLADALQALGDFVDIRSAWTRGHSIGVAQLAQDAARHLGLPESDSLAVWQAGCVHDLGMVSLPQRMCDSPGPLSDVEIERMRLHTYHVERALGRSPAFAPVAAIAGAHHERMDGSGYHRGTRENAPSARVLAAADVYRALREDRPHRPAFGQDEAAAIVAKEASAGRLDPDAAGAVLAAAGARPVGRGRPRLAGLTGREVEVLRLISAGRTNRQMAQALVISERTVDHHIRHIYDKLGVSTRAAATMFALQHQLVGGAADIA